MDQYLTTRELSELLRISIGTLARWRGANANTGPPFVRIEGSIRYPRDALRRWLDERTLGGALSA